MKWWIANEILTSRALIQSQVARWSTQSRNIQKVSALQGKKRRSQPSSTSTSSLRMAFLLWLCCPTTSHPKSWLSWSSIASCVWETKMSDWSRGMSQSYSAPNSLSWPPDQLRAVTYTSRSGCAWDLNWNYRAMTARTSGGITRPAYLNQPARVSTLLSS